jgi:hypothetical protein
MSSEIVTYDRNRRPIATCTFRGDFQDASSDAEWVALLVRDQGNRRPVLLRVSSCSTHEVPTGFMGDVAVFSIAGDGARYGVSEGSHLEIRDRASDRLVAARDVNDLPDVFNTGYPNWFRTGIGAKLRKDGWIMWLGAAYLCQPPLEAPNSAQTLVECPAESDAVSKTAPEGGC